ncbi:variant surface glycoprotein (VSG), putative [Trypanosoma brucei brucei TREU927]|uniref:Variant surface glycoprotein (VSG), putative n=1 Tax=Trypanosoma brucei brucei (strain 927/4 GUTat10.1) TaxID=185431 RepID=Q380U5_TRYB2|nr:variant surface glycoprotein [Trypanosoma brucei brucei TREU927]EAN80686.1 variant surface glycoprotein (VSG), putative [Trypanosoma brucei brucei TREU927]
MLQRASDNRSVPKALLIATAVAQLIIRHGSAESTQEAKQGDACSAAVYIMQLANSIDEQRSELINEISKANADLLQLETALALPQWNTKPTALTPLIGLVLAEQQKLISRLATCNKAAADAARSANIQAGRNWAVAELAEITTASSAGTAASTLSAGGKVQDTATFETIHGDTCTNKEAGSIAKAATGVAISALKTLTLFKLKEHSTPGNRQICLGHCDGQGKACTAQAARHKTKTQSKKFLEEDTRDTIDMQASAHSQPEKASEEENGKTYLKAHKRHLNWRLYNFNLNKPCKATYTSLDKAATTQTNEPLRRSVLAVVKGPNEKYDTDSKEQQKVINTFIESNYGKEESDFKEKVWNKIREPDFSCSIGSKDFKGKITAITTSDHITIAIGASGYTAPTSKECKETSLQAKPTPEKCQEETEKSKCTADKDCEHSDGKCKLKEGVKAENDAKPTNTTGNNSFVINEAPLLLADLFILLGF